MKKLFLLAVCMLSMLTVSAQMKPTMMFEVGIGMSGWTGDAAKVSNALFNPRVGISADIPLNEWFSFQPGLSWVSKGVKSDISSQGVNSDVQINQNYFQVPLMAAFHMRATDNFDLVFTAGPYIAVGVNGKTEVDVDDMTMSWKTFKDGNVGGTQIWDGFRRFDAGIGIGAALDFPHWIVGVDADFGLCRLYKDGPRNYDLFFSAGFKF